MVVVLALLVGLLLGAVLTHHLVHRHLAAESRRAIGQLRATLDALEAAHGIALAAVRAQRELQAEWSRLDRGPA